MEIEPTIYFVTASVIGSILYHVSGYLDAKKQNPSIKYSYNYMLQTIIATISIATGYTVSDIEWSHYNLLLAFVAGMGGTVAISKLYKKVVSEPKNTHSEI